MMQLKGVGLVFYRVHDLIDRLGDNITRLPTRHDELKEAQASDKKVEDGETHVAPIACDFRWRVHNVLKP